MDIDATRISVQIRRVLAISIRTCYRSFCKHPFLVGFLCFLIFLYRSFPLLFSLLVSASPVLVCTAILLGTLLSFGEPNIPEIEKGKEELSHEISSLKAGVVEDATVVVERDESFCVERFVGKMKDLEGKDFKEENLAEQKDSRVEGDDGLGDYMPLVAENSREIQFEKQVIEELERESNYLALGKKREIHKDKEVSSDGEVEHQYSFVQNVGDKIHEVEDDNLPGQFTEAKKGERLDSSWRPANDNEEVEEEDEDVSDSGSDGAESSSPDASMADIIPMLDELHPLLDEEAPQRAHMSHDGSDGGSEQSHKSEESSVESEDEVENQADDDGDGDGGDDNDNEEEVEEAPEDKEDESKSAIKWTEDDQKNLMDLGTSELERNQRLESLIARRRARRNLRLVAEKNLIDFDVADLPFNIPAISTTRHTNNPFDLPHDDVPGSAPSILLPRRNPFDLPYDSNEEKPDLKGDSFQHEFSSFQHREPVFRRHESFSVGPSVLAGPRQERQDLRWKPYFVPERFATDGTSYHSFQRQLSEVSDSKMSSVPDTDSVTSALEEEDKRLNEEDVSQETEMISNVDHGSLLVERGSLTSEDIDSLDIEQVEKREVHDDGVNISLEHAENHHETDSSLSASGGATPVEINTSEILLRMGHGEEYSSRSSLSSLSEIDETIADVNGGSTSLEPTSMRMEGSHILTQTSVDSDFRFIGGMEDNNQQSEPVLEPRDGHIGESVILTRSTADSDFSFTRELINENQHAEPVLEPIGNQIGHSGILQQTSLKPDLQFMSGVADGNQEPVSEPKGNHIGEFAISTQTSLKSDLHFTKVALHDNQHKEPVYDSSPPSVEKFLSFSSVSSDSHGETSEMGSPSKLAVFADKESNVHSESMEKDTSGYREVLEACSQACSLDENESREVTDNSEHNVTKVEVTEVDPNFDSKNGFMGPESVIEDMSVDLPPSSFDKGSVKEDGACKEKGSYHEWNLSSLDEEVIVNPHQDVFEMADSASSNHEMASEEINLPAAEEQNLPVVVEHVLADPKESSSKAEPVQERAIGLEEVLELEENQVSSSSFDDDIYVNGCKAVGRELGLEPSSSEHMLSIDLNLSEHEERQPSVVFKQASDANLNKSSSETKHEEENSFRKEENHQFEQNEVQSSSFDANVGAGASLHQDVDLTVVSSGSSYQHVPAEENSPQELKKELSWSDKSIVEPSFNNHDEPQEPSIILTESAEEASIGNNVNVLESYQPEEQVSINIASLISKSTLVAPESLEYKAPDREVVLKDDMLDKIVYEDSPGHSNYLAEAHGSHGAEANIHEDEDDIKEIDEGLLSELDTVGDFSVKEVVDESLHDEQMPENTTYGGPESDFLPKDSSVAEIKMELPARDVRSVEDIDLAFKQLHEGVAVEEVIHPSMIENQFVVDESKYPGETSSHLQAEARSLEDICVDMKQVSEDNTEELSDSKDTPEEVNEVGSTEELPVLEVRTVEDIDLAFQQLNEGVDVEEVILPSMIEQEVVVDEPKDHVQISSDLQVVEARSLEDLHTAMKQLSEDSPKLSDPKDKPAEANEVGSTNEYESRTSEGNETEVRSVEGMESSNVAEIKGGSTKESESNAVESGVQESITNAPRDSKHGFDETSGNSSLTLLDAEGKKEKSHSSSDAD